MKKLKIILLIILLLIPSIFNFYPDKIEAKTIAELREELSASRAISKFCINDDTMLP